MIYGTDNIHNALEKVAVSKNYIHRRAVHRIGQILEGGTMRGAKVEKEEALQATSSQLDRMLKRLKEESPGSRGLPSIDTAGGQRANARVKADIARREELIPRYRGALGKHQEKLVKRESALRGGPDLDRQGWEKVELAAYKLSIPKSLQLPKDKLWLEPQPFSHAEIMGKKTLRVPLPSEAPKKYRKAFEAALLEEKKKVYSGARQKGKTTARNIDAYYRRQRKALGAG
jgi:hypothetical protein